MRVHGGQSREPAAVCLRPRAPLDGGTSEAVSLNGSGLGGGKKGLRIGLDTILRPQVFTDGDTLTVLDGASTPLFGSPLPGSRAAVFGACRGNRPFFSDPALYRPQFHA